MTTNNWDEDKDKIHFLELDIDVAKGERITLMGTNKRGQLVLHSNTGRTWVSTQAPMPHLDMVEITGMSKEVKRDGK